jgi:hypothetical protein
MCPSLDPDLTVSYRAHVLFARVLAAKGIAVQRFHYRGTGNSFGDPAETTFETLREDALAAVEEARSDAGSAPLAFLGRGWGALVAASITDAFPSVPLILWEPVSEPARYYREALLAVKSRQVVEPIGLPSVETSLEGLPPSGCVDVFGFALYSRLYESSKRRLLADDLGAGPRRVLMLLPEGRRVRTEYARLEAALRERGLAVDVARAGEPFVAWFTGRHDPAAEEVAGAAAACVRDWLAGAVAT